MKTKKLFKDKEASHIGELNKDRAPFMIRYASLIYKSLLYMENYIHTYIVNQQIAICIYTICLAIKSNQSKAYKKVLLYAYGKYVPRIKNMRIDQRITWHNWLLEDMIIFNIWTFKQA